MYGLLNEICMIQMGRLGITNHFKLMKINQLLSDFSVAKIIACIAGGSGCQIGSECEFFCSRKHKKNGEESALLLAKNFLALLQKSSCAYQLPPAMQATN